MPVRWRLTLFNALAIGAILVALGFALFFLLRGALLSDIRQTVESQAEAAVPEVEDQEDARELASEDEAGELTRDGVFLVVRDREGDILVRRTDLAGGLGGKAASDPLFRRALQAGEPVSGTVQPSGRAPVFIHAVPVDPEDGPPLVIEAGKSYGSVQQTLAIFRDVLIAGLAAALALSVLGAYLLARAALSPVEAVTEAAREMTDEDLSRRLPVAHSKDEIGRLAATINDLLARLQTAFARRDEALKRQRRFVSDAGHELKTPLTSIGGYARMLEKWGLGDPEKAEEGVAAIRRESERMRDLVEGLLALARGDEGAPMNPEPADLAEVAAEAVETTRAAADGKVAIGYAPPEGQTLTTFDRDRVREAISILLDNSVKYTPQGGKVAVSVTKKVGWTGVGVADDGVGIPEEQLPLVFERFHRIDEARSEDGAGLGLPIARQIAEAHGGRIEVESEPGEGSTFTFWLPGE